jgi:hypothetical protein
MPPSWLDLLVPLPDDAVVERKSVASPELIAAGKADAIAGWENISVNLSDPSVGLRHVMLTLDGSGTLISGGDSVLFHTEENRGGELWNIYEHHSIGGRFESDGSFGGTRWYTRNEHFGDADEPATSSSTPSPPSPQDIEQLRALAAWLLARAPVTRA